MATNGGISVPTIEEQGEPEINNGLDYAALVCTDVGLKCLSPKLLSLSVTEVGCCLGLDEELISSIENDSKCNDKRHRLLAEWSDKERKRTWGTLSNCFENLNDDSLMKAIEQIARDTGNLEDRGELYTEDISELALDKEPIQAEGDNMGQLAVSCGWEPPREETPSPNLREEITKLQGDFDDILVLVQQSFRSHAVHPEDLRLRITSLCVNQKQNIPFYNKSILEVINTQSYSEIFAFMTRLEAWDFLNFHILQEIVKKCIPDDAGVQQKIAKHTHEVGKFKKDTLLKDFIRVRCSGATSIPGYRRVMVKIDRKYSRYTLADLASEEGFLANLFLLNQFIFRLRDGASGCIQITWLVPANAIQLLKPVVLARQGKALKERSIIEIRVDDQYVYTNPDPHEAPRALIPSVEGYDSMYQQSVKDPESFWSVQAKNVLEWDQEFTTVNDCKKNEGIVKWFTGGKLNVSRNCLDRHVAKHPQKTAIIWEKNERKHEKISYKKLLEQTCQVANVLKNTCGVKKGDTVVIYMPMMPLAVASMLACARIGAVHSVVFAALSPEKLKQRIVSAEARVLITADGAPIGRKYIPLKEKVDEALRDGNTPVQHVLVAKRIGTDVPMKRRDISLDEAMMKESTECEPVSMDSEDDLFVMYTSGTTGDPIGVVHTQAGYLLTAALTHKYVFDYQEGDVFACVAVLGWITGHTYVVYGPLCNGATTVLFEGTATYPDAGRYWEMVERLKVNQFYTTPSAIRKLMKASAVHVNRYDLSSLKTIGSVGEPLSTKGWKWYYKVVGQEKCVLVDTWWQTETGGIAISPQPGPPQGKLKPGYPMRPFFGVQPVLTDEKGNELKGNGVQGLLSLRQPTPGMCRRIISHDMSLKNNYFHCFSSNPGLYFTQDYAYRDADGHYQVQGRKDDIIRIKGVWLQVPEIESRIAQSDRRIEDAVIVGVLHDPKQQKCNLVNEHPAVLVQVKPTVTKGEHDEIAENVRKEVYLAAGSSAVPRDVYFTKEMAKTHSGKINRLVVKKEMRKLRYP